MARTLTPERRELALEAKNLREFGYTQQEIADAFRKPRRTIAYWLSIVANGTSGKVATRNHLARIPLTTMATIDITLYPCRYEEKENDIPRKSVDLILTDPPYLVSDNDITRTNQASLHRDSGEWDKTPEHAYQDSVKTWAQLMSKQLKVGGSLYLFISFRQSHIWVEAFENNGLQFGNVLLWHRVNPAPQIRQTRWCSAFDLILFYTKGAPKTFIWLGQNEMHNVIKGPEELHNVITGPICAGNEREYHPTQKPRWLLQKLLQVSSKPGDVVLDPFAGSGSTAFAVGHMPRRKFILVEPEPKYVGLIQSIAKDEFGCKVTLNDN